MPEVRDPDGTAATASPSSAVAASSAATDERRATRAAARGRARLDGRRASLADRLKTLALHPLPQHLISRAVLALTRRRSRLVAPAIRRFVHAFEVDMSEAAEPDVAAYDTFNAFFTRALAPGARPLATGERTMVSPVDGRVSALGDVVDARVLQAKGIDYSLRALLGDDPEATERLGQGRFATFYLSPRDYHRVHMPLAGTLRRQIHVPGRLFGVGPHVVRALEGLFTRNERVVALFETDHGLMALVLVGAVNVGAIETVWHGLVTPPAGQVISRVDYTGGDAIRLERGAEMGRFNMGSSVVLLLESAAVWDARLEAGSTVRMGERIGEIMPA